MRFAVHAPYKECYLPNKERQRQNRSERLVVCHGFEEINMIIKVIFLVKVEGSFLIVVFILGIAQRNQLN